MPSYIQELIVFLACYYLIELCTCMPIVYVHNNESKRYMGMACSPKISANSSQCHEGTCTVSSAWLVVNYAHRFRASIHEGTRSDSDLIIKAYTTSCIMYNPTINTIQNNPRTYSSTITYTCDQVPRSKLQQWRHRPSSSSCSLPWH